MASNFSSLRKSRESALAKLNEELKKESSKGGQDDRFWKLSVDQKTKVGYARLRFLPAPKGEDIPWARLFSHNFKINGTWLIENCPTTLGQRPCPVCKDNNRLWNSGIEADKDVARTRKRKLQFISNVLILEDPAHPENVGKVFLFRYGAKIHEKIQEQINPQYPDQKPTDPFDMWEGCDFKLKAAQVAGFQNYDKSEFADPSELFAGKDDKKEEVWEKEYPLTPFVAEDQFKNYDELEKRFNKVVSGDTNDAPKTAEAAMKQEQPSLDEAIDAAEAVAAADTPAPTPTTKKRTTKKTAPTPPPPPVEPEGDDDEDADTPPESEDDIAAFFGKVLD